MCLFVIYCYVRCSVNVMLLFNKEKQLELEVWRVFCLFLRFQVQVPVGRGRLCVKFGQTKGARGEAC